MNIFFKNKTINLTDSQGYLDVLIFLTFSHCYLKKEEKRKE